MPDMDLSSIHLTSHDAEAVHDASRWKAGCSENPPRSTATGRRISRGALADVSSRDSREAAGRSRRHPLATDRFRNGAGGFAFPWPPFRPSKQQQGFAEFREPFRVECPFFRQAVSVFLIQSPYPAPQEQSAQPGVSTSRKALRGSDTA